MKTKSPDATPVPFADGRFCFAGPTPVPLDRIIRERFPGSSWNEARRLIHRGKVSVDGKTVNDATACITPGATVELFLGAPRSPSPSTLPPDVLVHADADVAVANKPSGLATVPFEDERDTFDRRVAALLRRRGGPRTAAPLGVVQRLDKETSGLLVFARNVSAKRHLQQQLREHTVHRRYVALAHGTVADGTLRSRLVRDCGDGRRGSTARTDLGREAVTHVRVLERFRSATLIECRLETGRTHQIRIHLAEASHPLLGEHVYGRGYAAPGLAAPRVMLHARDLGFSHPATGKRLEFTVPPPDDFRHLLEGLRKSG